MRKIGLAVLIVLPVGSATALAAGQAIRKGQYSYSHTSGHNSLIGDLTLGRKGVSKIGITTDLLECNRPGQKAFFPGPPFNWQPQKTFPVKHVKGGLKISFTAAFGDWVSGFPETMMMDARITSKGIAGKVKLYADDNTAGSGEEICHTRGFVSFAGKHS